MSERDSHSGKEKEQQHGRKVVIQFERGEKSAPELDGAAVEPARAENSPVPASPAAESESALTEQLARLQAQKDDLMQTLVRRQADFENYRKRVERDRESEHRRGVGQLMEELIPVLDAFERALKAHEEAAYEEHRKGWELIYRQLWNLLARHGLERIVAAGAAFDPHVHQAIERVETAEHPDGAIVEVLQNGYLFHGRVLRPSIVRVAVHPGGAGENSSSAEKAQ